MKDEPNKSDFRVESKERRFAGSVPRAEKKSTSVREIASQLPRDCCQTSNKFLFLELRPNFSGSSLTVPGRH